MLSFKTGSTRFTLTFGFAAMVCAAFVFGAPQMAAAGLFCILWHESGHLLAMKMLHVLPENVYLTVLGIALVRPRFSGYRQEIFVALAGPLFNLLAAALLWPLEKFRLLFRLHLVLGLFHLLPVLPLDGGQVLEKSLCLHLGEQTARKAAAVVSAAVLFPLGVLGFLLLFSAGPNPSLLLLCVYLFGFLVFRKK